MIILYRVFRKKLALLNIKVAKKIQNKREKEK